ncbi:MAG: hypothetical protein HYV63_00490 [Candidatus Schekmanbacteria bacterium]|nr:hypothetical protein [Candidatus Schekmanbacteria bacterium]
MAARKLFAASELGRIGYCEAEYYHPTFGTFGHPLSYRGTAPPTASVNDDRRRDPSTSTCGARQARSRRTRKAARNVCARQGSDLE